MMNSDKHKQIKTIAESVSRLWNTRDELSFKKIRISHLAYSLPIVIILTLLDQRNTYFAIEDATFMGSHTAILVYATYCAGSLFVLLFGMKWMIGGLRCFCTFAVAGFICWLIFQHSEFKIIPMMIFQFGLGGCAIYAMYAYVFVLRNAERLFGIFLVTFNYGLFVVLQQNGITNLFLSRILPAFFVLLLAICVYYFRKEEFPELAPQAAVEPPRGLYLVLACPFAFFSLNVFGEAIINNASGSADMRGAGAMAAVLLALVLQFVLRRSVWHLLNLFLIFTLTGITILALLFPLHWLSLLTMQKANNWLIAGNFLFGIGDGLGYIMVFYLTGLIKKYHNIRLFLNITLATVIELILSIAAAYFVKRYFPESMPLIAVLLALFFLCLFLLYSPEFQRHIFATGWIDDYCKLDMTPADQQLFELSVENKPLSGDLFNDFLARITTLTPTERQIFEYYVEGRTAQEVMELMFITMGTLKAHNTKIYTKMNVTSRDSLLLYIDLIKKSGLSFN